ncbi:MAG TPA: hypothetical protein VGD77_13425 [Gemmatimonadaceae bacterium]
MTLPTVSRALIGLFLINLAAALVLSLFLPPAGALAAAPGGKGLLTVALWASAVFYPVSALAQSAVLSLVAWSIASLMGTSISFSPTIRALLTAEFPLAAAAPWSALVIALRGGAATPADLAVPTGLGAFMSLPAGWISVLAEQAGLFHIVWVAAMLYLFRTQLHLPRGAAWTAALACWMTALGGALIRANLTS